MVSFWRFHSSNFEQYISIQMYGYSFTHDAPKFRNKLSIIVGKMTSLSQYRSYNKVLGAINFDYS